jgi:hypothetical protein
MELYPKMESSIRENDGCGLRGTLFSDKAASRQWFWLMLHPSTLQQFNTYIYIISYTYIYIMILYDMILYYIISYHIICITCCFLQTCFFHVQFGKRVGSASKMFLEHLGLRVLGNVKKTSILENVGVLWGWHGRSGISNAQYNMKRKVVRVEACALGKWGKHTFLKKTMNC